MRPLIAALSDQADDVRRSAIGSLGRLGDASAVPPLIAALSDESEPGRGGAAGALGRLRAIDAVPALMATSTAASEREVIPYAVALTHLDPSSVLPVLERYARQFRQASWVERARGQALWRLGELDKALHALEEALDKEGDSGNLLSLGHFHIEQGDLSSARECIHGALEAEPRDPLCLQSHAILLWEMGHSAQALEELARARKGYRQVTSARDLEYAHSWRPKALAALEAMLAQSDTAGPDAKPDGASGETPA